MMTIINIAGYRFIELDDLATLQHHFLSTCNDLMLRGTILLSPEGINMSLAGDQDNMVAFKAMLAQDARFATISFHETRSSHIPFRKLKVKIKKEIITFRQAVTAQPAALERAPSIKPTLLKQWLDEQKDITLLDTRNDFEVQCGTFEKAINPHIQRFTDLPGTLAALDRQKPVVMFCTGGIRCEKAAHYMESVGFKEVYQLDGGILGYFKEVGGAHWIGDCFIFDDRIALNPHLETAQIDAC